MHPPDRLPHRLRQAALAIFSALVLLTVTVWLLRASLARWGVERVLEQQGLGPVTVEVLEVGPVAATLRVLRSAVGEIERIHVEYSLRSLALGRLDLLQIQGARLQGVWGEGLLRPQAGPARAPAALPVRRIAIEHSRVNMRFKDAILVAKLSATLTTDTDIEDLFVQLSAEQLVVAGRSLGAPQLTAALHGPAKRLRVALESSPLSLSLDVDGSLAASGAPFTLEMRGDARGLAALAGATQDARGQLHVQIAGKAPPAPSLQAVLSKSARDWLRSAAAGGELTGTVEALAIPRVARLGQATTALHLKLADGALRLSSHDGLSLRDLAIAEALIPADSRWATVTYAAFEPATDQPLLTLSSSPDGGSATLAAALRFETPTAKASATISAQATLASTPSANTPAGQPITGQCALRTKLSLALTGERVLPDIDAAVEGAFSLSDDQQRVVLKQGRIEIPAQALQLDELTGVVTRASDQTTIKLTRGTLRSTATPALFVPLRATVDARITAPEARYSARLSAAEQLIDLTAQGEHQRQSARGNLRFTLAPVDLAQHDALQRLSPALLANFNASAGSLAAHGEVSWGKSAPPATLTVEIKNVAVSGAAFRASSTNGELVLDSLTPLHSPAAQQFSTVIDLAMLKQVPLNLSFHVEPTRLVIEHASAATFGGRFETRDAEFNASTGEGRLDLAISDLNLEPAFAVLNLDQVKGSGRISGVLPLRIAGHRFAIEQGHLAASAPGTLQIDTGTFADQLKGYGENADLAFRALRDFHYQHLAIDALKPLTGGGQAAIRLEGNNPSLMDGQPFVFNIRLETDFDRLAQLFLDLSGATDTALGWGAQGILRQ